MLQTGNKNWCLVPGTWYLEPGTRAFLQFKLFLVLVLDSSCIIKLVLVPVLDQYCI